MTGFLTAADGNRIPVFDGMIVGRVVGCDLVVDDTKVSRRHARLIVAGTVAEIEDLGSSNGTLLNGKLVARRVLRDGDEIGFGSVVFRYTEAASAPAAAPSPAAPAAAPVFEDDLDLFGGPATAAAAPKPPAAPPRPPVTAPVTAPVAPPRAAPPAAPPPRPVVEFADEVVEIKPVSRPAPTAASAGEPQVQRQQKVLQFSRNKDVKKGGLGDDLAQLSSGKRAVIYIALAVVFVGVVVAIVQLMG